ncbi:MAG: hypothetical protein CMH55_03470 [Myxococcales bacterium]|nr:hypothetical protein [Myxococcales bacterium]
MGRLSIVFALGLAACGGIEPAETRTTVTVTGDVDGRAPVFSGAGWAWERPRADHGALGVDYYELHLVLTNANMDPLVHLESLPVLTRHDLAREAALGDFIHVTMIRRGEGEEVENNGTYPEATALNDTAEAQLVFGSQRGPNEPTQATLGQRPFKTGQVSSWQVMTGDVERPSRDVAGALDGRFSLDLVEGNTPLGGLDLDVQVPLVGEGYGSCQLSLLSRPEGTSCFVATE